MDESGGPVKQRRNEPLKLVNGTVNGPQLYCTTVEKEIQAIII